MNAPIHHDRLMPHSLQSEQTLLGILLTDPLAFDRIADTLITADLFVTEHQLIFGTMSRLHAAGK